MESAMKSVEALVRVRFPKAHDFHHQVALTLPEGAIDYVEFDNGQGDLQDFFYCLIGSSGVSLWDDALDAVAKIQNIIESRKTFWQRVTQGNVSDLVASTIALTVTFGFALHTAIKGTPDQSLLSIFTLVLGYYFGKRAA